MTLSDLRQKIGALSHLPDTSPVRILVELTMEEPLDEIESLEDLAEIEVQSSAIGDPEIILCM